MSKFGFRCGSWFGCQHSAFNVVLVVSSHPNIDQIQDRLLTIELFGRQHSTFNSVLVVISHIRIPESDHRRCLIPIFIRYNSGIQLLQFFIPLTSSNKDNS